MLMSRNTRLVSVLSKCLRYLLQAHPIGACSCGTTFRNLIKLIDPTRIDALLNVVNNPLNKTPKGLLLTLRQSLGDNPDIVHMVTVGVNTASHEPIPWVVDHVAVFFLLGGRAHCVSSYVNLQGPTLFEMSQDKLLTAISWIQDNVGRKWASSPAAQVAFRALCGFVELDDRMFCAGKRANGSVHYVGLDFKLVSISTMEDRLKAIARKDLLDLEHAAPHRGQPLWCDVLTG